MNAALEPFEKNEKAMEIEIEIEKNELKQQQEATYLPTYLILPGTLGEPSQAFLSFRYLLDVCTTAHTVHPLLLHPDCLK